MFSEITEQTLMWKMIAGGIGVLLPVLVFLIWKRKTSCKWKPMIVGVVTFIVFAQILESIPKLFLFSGDTALSDYVWNHAWAYVLAGCLMAGVFEEVGRYVAFRFFLKECSDRKDAVTYGIGHGGIESILVLGVSGISSISMAAVINSGLMEQTISAMSTGQLRSVELQVAALTGYGAAGMLIDVLERVIAMTLHVALSVVVFRAVREKKAVFLLLAVGLHAFFDVPAALYQCGVIGKVPAEIGLVLILAAVAVVSRKFYVNMRENAGQGESV